MFPRHCKEMQMQHKPTSAHTAFPGERSAPGQQARYDSAYTITGDALAHTSPWVWRTTTTHDRSWHTIWDIWPTTCDRTWHTIDDVWPTTYDRTRHTIDDIWPTTHVRTWHTNTTYDPAFTTHHVANVLPHPWFATAVCIEPQTSYTTRKVRKALHMAAWRRQCSRTTRVSLSYSTLCGTDVREFFKRV